MNEIKLSFIVPVYNVEKFIGECLESIYGQDISENEYEVICIDDCSPDNSIQIIEDYQKTHINLRLITHEANKGLGGARNTGLKNAKGKYIWFVDSDDKIKSENISLIYRHLNEELLEIILFNYKRISETGVELEEENVFDNSDILSGKDFIDIHMGNVFVYHLGYVWRCIYRTDYILSEKIYFPENCFWEDTAFFPKSILLAKNVISLKNTFYKYRINNNSISGNKNKYKADRYFQFSFFAGKDLFDFSKEYIKIDQKMGILLGEKSIWYYNSFIKPLLLSNLNEKKKFFNLVRRHTNILQITYSYLYPLNKFICKYPTFGLLIVTSLSPLYKLNRKLKKK